MRFIDSTKAHGWWVDEESLYAPDSSEDVRKHYDSLQRKVLSSINFDIQGVAELLWDDALSGWWESSFAPPFEHMILEYRMGGYMERVAIYAHVRDVVRDFDNPELRHEAARHWWRSVAEGQSDQSNVTAAPIEQARWLISLFLFTKDEKRNGFNAPVGRACFALDADGRPLSDGGSGFFLDLWISKLIIRHCHSVTPASSPEEDERHKEDTAARALEADLVQPFMATMALLNTKNIETREVLPSRQMRRDAERRNVDAPVTYRVLTVRVPGSARTSDVKRQTTSLENQPIHIVRGHLARYGPDYDKGKLFGKYEGQFWIPAHVRGNAEAGKIVKDYNVKAPRSAA